MIEPFDPDRTIVKPGKSPARVLDETVVLGDQKDRLALLPGTRIGDLEILKLIGVGGLGIVYLARDHSLDRLVALKEFMPSSVATRGAGFSVSVRFERHADAFAAGLRSFIEEAHLLAGLDHPSLVKVHRLWETGGTAFMVMPYYEGPTLKQALQELGAPPSQAWLKDVLGPVMDALQVLHRENCFHLDISPDTILLSKSGQPVLLDPGAARRVIGDMTENLTMIVKSGFAPIEQYSKDHDVPQGAWTDIYAIGALAYFAITGKAPAPSTSRVVNDPVVPLAQLADSQYEARFLHAMDQALQVNPRRRPQSIDELLGLLGWSDSAHIAIEPEEQVTVAEPVNRKKRLPVKAIAGALVLAVALLVMGTVWFTSPSVSGPTVESSTDAPVAAQPAAIAVAPDKPDTIAAPALPEPTQAQQAQVELPPAQAASASSSPVPLDKAAAGALADGGAPAPRAVGANAAAPAKAPPATAARQVRPPVPEKRPPAPATTTTTTTTTTQRPPVPVEPPPVAAAEIRAPAPVQTAPEVVLAKPAEPASAPVVVEISPSKACQTALLNWICMKEMCSKPELRGNKECAQWRSPGPSR